MSGEGRAARPRAALPDLVYPVRPGENEELRYSLRSFHENGRGMFRKVWIVGTGLPAWLTGVETIEAGAEGRVADVRAKITAAANHPKIAAQFLIVHDDHFLVEPVTGWEPFHMGPTSEYIRHLAATQRLTVGNSSWVRAVSATAEWMAQRGFGDVPCRQGHRPLLWDRRKLADALGEYPADRPLDVVGMYELAGAFPGEGRRVGNAKVGQSPDAFHAKVGKLDIPWLSSNDRSFAEGMVGGYIRGMFRRPSPWEA